jgi:hypothetical protein
MPLLSDIFNQRPFQAIELTAAFDAIDYVPMPLGEFGQRLFPTQRVRTRTIAVAKGVNRYALIPVSPIGAPPVELEKLPGDVRPFVTRRLAKGSTVTAESLQGVFSLPMLEQISSVQAEVADRARMIREDIELTKENMRLGAVMGQVYDADGTTVLDDWFSNWGEAVPTPIAFDLDVTTTAIRAKCQAVIRHMQIAGKGGWVAGRTEVHAITGFAFFDALISHPEVTKTYINWPAARELRDAQPDTFSFGGITFHSFRPADDGETLTPVEDDEAHFFPVGGNNVFAEILAPAEFDPFINQAGRDIYAISIPDRDRGAWQRFEGYVYPLYMCLRPAMLIKGTLT